MREHRDGAGLHRADGLQQTDLIVGEVDVGAVVALRLLLVGEAEEHDGHVGGTRGRERGVATLGVGDLSAGTGPDLVEGMSSSAALMCELPPP